MNGNGLKLLVVPLVTIFLAAIGWLFMDHLRVSGEQQRRTTNVLMVEELRQDIKTMTRQLDRMETNQTIILHSLRQRELPTFP